MILNSLVGKKVRILWVDAQATDPDDFELLAYDPSTNWVCIQRIAKAGIPPESCLPTIVRADDIDQIVIIDPTYNPGEFNKAINGVVQALQAGSLPRSNDASQSSQAAQVAVATEQTPQGQSAVRASMVFDLPTAGEEFYICTRATNAFSVLWELGRKFQEDVKNPAKYKTAAEAVKKLHKFMLDELKKGDINIEW